MSKKLQQKKEILQTAGIKKASIKSARYFDKLEKTAESQWFGDCKDVYFRETRKTYDVSEKNFPSDLQGVDTRRRYAIYNLVYRMHIELIAFYRSLSVHDGKKKIDDEEIKDNFETLSRRHEIINYFARGSSIEEVQKIAIKDWKLTISKKNLEKIRLENLEEIGELQKEYSNNFDGFRLGFKKSRMEELNSLYNKSKGKLEDENRAMKVSEENDTVRLCQSLLESIRKEAEGDILRIEGNQKISVETVIQSQIENEILKYMPLHEVLISRACARLNMNPLLILHALHKSTYSSLTGYRPRTKFTDDKEKIVFPSTFNYDMDKLLELNINNSLQLNETTNKFNRMLDVDISTINYEELNICKGILDDKVKDIL